MKDSNCDPYNFDFKRAFWDLKILLAYFQLTTQIE